MLMRHDWPGMRLIFLYLIGVAALLLGESGFLNLPKGMISSTMPAPLQIEAE